VFVIFNVIGEDPSNHSNYGRFPKRICEIQIQMRTMVLFPAPQKN